MISTMVHNLFHHLFCSLRSILYHSRISKYIMTSNSDSDDPLFIPLPLCTHLSGCGRGKGRGKPVSQLGAPGPLKASLSDGIIKLGDSTNINEDDSLDDIPLPSTNTGLHLSSSADQVSLLSSNTVSLQTPLVPMRRPPNGVSTAPRRIKLVANYYVISINPHMSTILHYFDVEIRRVRFPTPNQFQSHGDHTFTQASNHSCVNMKSSEGELITNRKYNRQLFWYAIKQFPGIFGYATNIVYDDRKQMISKVQLFLKPYHLEFAYPGNATLDSEMKRFVLRIKPCKVSSKSQQSFTTPTCDLAEISSIHSEQFNRKNQQILHSLDILFRQGRLFNDNFIPIGRKFFLTSGQDRVDLSCGKELLRGFYSGTKIIDKWQFAFNIDIVSSAFYRAENLILICAEVLKGQNEFDHSSTVSIPNKLEPHEIRIIKSEIKGLKVTTHHTGQTFVIAKLSTDSALTKQFLWLTPDGNQRSVSLVEYFRQRYDITLQYPQWPCVVAVDKFERIFPIELCKICPNQQSKKRREVTDLLARKRSLQPEERLHKIKEMMKLANYHNDRHLEQFGVGIDTRLLDVEGTVLEPPKLQFRSRVPLDVIDGQWSINGEQLLEPVSIVRWCVLSFADVPDFKIKTFCTRLIREAGYLGVRLEQPQQLIKASPNESLQSIIQSLMSPLPEFLLQFLMVILPHRTKLAKKCYGDVKATCEQLYGLSTQCIQACRLDEIWSKEHRSPVMLQNIVLKINAKLNGINAQISDLDNIAIKYLYKPIIFIGADVTHPDSFDTTSPSIAAVASSLDNHPSRYFGIEMVQGHRQEIIQDLAKTIKSCLMRYFAKTKLKPEMIIFYRDGVSDGQFEQVMHHELRAIQNACRQLGDGSYRPGITFTIVQKRHHTRFFRDSINPRDREKDKNIPPGTVVDSVVSHPYEFDFYLASHSGQEGTTKPTHYTVLWDDNEFSADDFQALTYRLCHTLARCSQSISMPAPCMYAHHIAFRAMIRLKHRLSEMDLANISTDSNDRSPDIERLQQLIQVCDETKRKMYWQ